MKYREVKREEELKGKVGKDWFRNFDDTRILGNIDFCVSPKKQINANEPISLLWAEAKTKDYDVVAMFAQLIITIGKERTFDKYLPPAFLGAFDYKKIVFVPYNEVADLFYLNDFNWTVAPSNHETKEFAIIKDRIENILSKNTYLYDFIEDEEELKFFIKNNLVEKTEDAKIVIDKNNFVPIYLRWLSKVKPVIAFDWTEGKKQNIMDSDFYLADLFVDDKDTATKEDDTPLKEELFVVFKNGHYEIAKENIKSLFNAYIDIKDKEEYEQFWKKYKRPPLEEFHHYIIDRRDLLIPQDVRERKGAFFTPLMWVELSQKYIADALGKNWQDEYYVWDCAAGTGNLLVGLTNKYNIWASTLDMADVNVMKDRIKNGAMLLEDHVFQFDFLNDDFTKLPKPLQDIINDPEKRKKLVVYINPPYAEIAGKKIGVNLSKIHDRYSIQLEVANRELFAQFLIRIYFEIPNCKICEFSKQKALSGSNFKTFRKYFTPKLKNCFVVPADTFDNVKGQFPIGFKVWDTEIKVEFSEIIAHVFDKNGFKIGNHGFYAFDKSEYISKWILSLKKKSNFYLGWIEGITRNDFQSQNGICILNKKNQIVVPRGIEIFDINLTAVCICFAVRKSISATWLNDRDQFLYPNDVWQVDTEFQNDCVAFTLFSNNIQTKYGINHWLPFSEDEVGAREKFESNFMTQFINGKLTTETVNQLYNTETEQRTTALEFSAEATAVFDAGRELWKYYHSQKSPSFGVVSEGRGGYNQNASLYDIREHFQGRNEKGKMNNKSKDETYMLLISDLRAKLKLLAKKIEPKVYEYGFLKA